MTKPMRVYDAEVFYQTSKSMKIRAHTREEAIQKASKRAEDMGLSPVTLRVPFLEGDE